MHPKLWPMRILKNALFDEEHCKKHLRVTVNEITSQ